MMADLRALIAAGSNTTGTQAITDKVNEIRQASLPLFQAAYQKRMSENAPNNKSNAQEAEYENANEKK